MNQQISHGFKQKSKKKADRRHRGSRAKRHQPSSFPAQLQTPLNPHEAVFMCLVSARRCTLWLLGKGKIDEYSGFTATRDQGAALFTLSRNDRGSLLAADGADVRGGGGVSVETSRARRCLSRPTSDGFFCYS